MPTGSLVCCRVHYHQMKRLFIPYLLENGIYSLFEICNALSAQEISFRHNKMFLSYFPSPQPYIIISAHYTTTLTLTIKQGLLPLMSAIFHVVTRHPGTSMVNGLGDTMSAHSSTPSSHPISFSVPLSSDRHLPGRFTDEVNW